MNYLIILIKFKVNRSVYYGLHDFDHRGSQAYGSLIVHLQSITAFVNGSNVRSSPVAM
jgi:glutamine phosphoribosylpyrophosphate amidotransferase